MGTAIVIGNLGRAPVALAERFLAKVDTSGECWIWKASTDGHRYGQLSTRKNKGPAGAHRVAYEMFVGPIPEGMNICHHCDNPPCCRPTHLFLGTQADNVKDAQEKGRMRPGPNLRPGRLGHLGASLHPVVLKLCTVEGCTEKQASHTFCSAHSHRFRRHGNPLAGGRPRIRLSQCSVEGCGRQHRSIGFCAAHLHRFQRYGDPFAGGPMRQRKEVVA